MIPKKENPKNELIAFKVSKKFKDKLTNLCQQNNILISDFMREACKAYGNTLMKNKEQ